MPTFKKDKGFKLPGFSGFKFTADNPGWGERDDKDEFGDRPPHAPRRKTKKHERAKARIEKVNRKQRNVDIGQTGGKQSLANKLVGGQFGKAKGAGHGQEYKMGLADMRLFGGAGKKHLRNQGLALEGDHEKHIKKNRRKRDRLKKKGKVDSWGDRV